MKQKMYVQVTGYVFGAVGALHLARLVLGWEAMIGDWVVPMWVSLVAAAVGFYLAYTAFGYTKK